MKSDEVRGKIGEKLKSAEDIRKREELDNPKNAIWTKKRVHQWRRKFIQMKITNTIKWQEFCTAYINKQ
jgi:hypothetical protein